MPGPLEESPPEENSTGLLSLLHKRWAILLLLFGVTGVLGLPLLWMSRAYRPFGKVILSIVVTIYTALLFLLVYLLLWHVWREAQSVLG